MFWIVLTLLKLLNSSIKVCLTRRVTFKRVQDFAPEAFQQKCKFCFECSKPYWGNSLRVLNLVWIFFFFFWSIETIFHMKLSEFLISHQKQKACNEVWHLQIQTRRYFSRRHLIFKQLLQNFACVLGIPPVTCARSFGATVLPHMENDWMMQNFWSTPRSIIGLQTIRGVVYERNCFTCLKKKNTPNLGPQAISLIWLKHSSDLIFYFGSELTKIWNFEGC